jgi:hypothetical protein
MAEKKDNVSRALSVSSLLLSVFAFFYGSIDERYHVILSVAGSDTNLTLGNPPTVSVSKLALTFINSGNRPIVIERLAYSAYGLSSEPDADCTTKQETAAVSLKDILSAKLVQTVSPKVFEGFTIKAGESETKSFDFSGQVFSDAFAPDDKEHPLRFLVGCLYIQINTQASGRRQLQVTAASEDLREGPLPNHIMSRSSQSDLVNARWPFYLITNFMDSWQKSKDARDPEAAIKRLQGAGRK